MSDVDNHARGVLHMAVEKDCPTILSVLLEHGADPDQMDEDGCNCNLLLCSLAAHMYTCTCADSILHMYMYMCCTSYVHNSD